MTKRMLALILALTMVFTVLPTGYAADRAARVRGMTEGSCGDDVSWTLSIDEETGYGTLYIDGTGPMWDFSPEGAPWYAYRDSIDSLYLGFEIESLGACAFQDCAALSGVILPASLSSVGTGAFSGCTGLESFYVENPFCELDCGLSGLPERMIVYGYEGSTAEDYALEYGYAFCSNGSYQCSGSCGAWGDELTWCFDLGTGLLSIEGSGEMADFEPCGAPWYQFHDRIMDVYYSNETTTIGAYAFQDCTGISVFYCYGSSLTSIGAGAFSGCTALTSIELPESVASVGADAFSGCTSLGSISVWHPYCELNCGPSGLPGTVTVYGYDGSTAEAYALEYGYAFSSCGSYTLSGSSGFSGSDVSWYFDSASASLIISGSGVMQWPSDEELIKQWIIIHDHIREVYVYEGVTDIFWGVAATESWEWESFTSCASMESLYIYSPYCWLYLGEIGAVDTMTVYGYDGSTAEEFAERYGYSFSSLGSCALYGSLDGGNEWDSNWCLETGTGHLYVYGVSEVSCSLDTGYLQYPMRQYIRSVSFSEEVTSIAPYAFSDCSALSSVEIPSGMESVQSDAFYECSALETFIVNSFSCELLCGQTGLPENMTVYGYDGSSAEAYAEEYGYSFSSLGSYSCSGSCGPYGSDNLQWYYESETGTLTIYGSGEMTSDYYSPWYPIRKYIRAVSLPDGLTNVGQYAFEECVALTSIVIPESVTVIASDAFYGCSGLESIEIQNPACEICCGQSGPEGVMTVFGYTGSTAEAYASDYGYLFSSLGVLQYTGVCGAQGENLTWCFDRITGVLSIEGSGDMMNYSLEGGRSTAPWADFAGSITELSLADGITNLGAWAFYDCEQLTSVTIPGSVRIVESYTLSSPYLETVIFSEGVEYLRYHTLDSCTSLVDVWIPASMDVIDNTFDECESLRWIGVAAGNPRYYSYSGVLYNKEKTLLIRCPRGYTQTLTVLNGTTAIGEYAFSDCDQISYVNLPDSVTEIGDWAFIGCYRMFGVTMSPNVTKIGEGAFCYCDNLRYATVPDGVTEIGDLCFNACSRLASVKLGDSVASIGVRAFDGCSALSSVTIPAGVTSIGYGAFSGCKMSSVDIPEGLTLLSAEVFSYCTDLTSVVIPENVTRIRSNAFQGCTGLERMTIQNPDCEILCGKSGIPGTMEVCGYLDSTAQTYAEEYGYTFLPLTKFTDVNPSAWYAASVAWAYQNGITDGTGANTFSPNSTCTREQVMTFLWRAEGMPEPADPENPFTEDVKEGKYYTDAVLWAYSHTPRITTGIRAGRFGVGQSCTRSQVVTFLWRLAGSPEPESMDSPFADVRNSGLWYYKAVLWAAENQITTGTGPYLFSPNETCTRAQVVTFLYRYASGKDAAE